MSHVNITPATAPIWGAPEGCLGYPQLIPQIPKQPSASADEGIAAHDLAAAVLRAAAEGKGTLDINPTVTIGVAMPNGVICTDEMVDAVQVYLNDVAEVIDSTGVEVWGCDTEVKIPKVYEHMVGRVNAWVFDDSTGTLYLWYFKYGRTLVDVYENERLVLDALGILDLLGLDVDDINFDLRIAQPRGFHADGVIRSWKCNDGPIRAIAMRLTRHAAVAANTKHAETRSGKHCKNCRAKYACASAQASGLQAVEFSNAPVPVEMDNATLGTYLRILQRSAKNISDMTKGIESQVKVLLKKGESIPGYAIEDSYGNLDWVCNEDRIRTLEIMFGLDLFKTKPVTPSQAITDHKIPRSIIEEYAEKPQRGEKLVIDDLSKARRIFENQPDKED